MANEKGNTRVFVLALGLLVGFVIGFVMLLANLPVDTTLSDVEVARANSPAAIESRNDFEFYTMLADSANRPAEVTTRPDSPLDNVIAVATPGQQQNQQPLQRAIAPATRVVPGAAQNLNRRNVASEVYAEIPAANYGQESYFLQTGNYRSAEEAERRRAEVLLLGLDAFIVTREEPNGGVGHRVRVGPFVDQSRMVDAKKRLRQGKVLYDIIRVTG